MGGIGLLFEELGLDPTSDVKCLVLLWKLGASEKPGQITLTEWGVGMKKLGVESIEGLKRLLPGCDLGFMEEVDFKSFFKFVFKFNLENAHKTIEKDLIVVLLQMVLGERNNIHLSSFCDFLTKGGENSRITCDQVRITGTRGGKEKRVTWTHIDPFFLSLSLSFLFSLSLSPLPPNSGRASWTSASPWGPIARGTRRTPAAPGRSCWTSTLSGRRPPAKKSDE